MTERDGFGSGFLMGTLVGGVIGGVIGAIAASRQTKSPSSLTQPEEKTSPLETDESMESARRSLEDKISQLNLAIDDVRQQLGGVNANRTEE